MQRRQSSSPRCRKGAGRRVTVRKPRSSGRARADVFDLAFKPEALDILQRHLQARPALPCTALLCPALPSRAQGRSVRLQPFCPKRAVERTGLLLSSALGCSCQAHWVAPVSNVAGHTS